VLVCPLAKQVTNNEFRVAFHALLQARMAQENREVVAPVNPRVGTAATRVSVTTKGFPLDVKWHIEPRKAPCKPLSISQHKIMEKCRNLKHFSIQSKSHKMKRKSITLI